MARGWTTIALKDELAARIDAFLQGEGVSLGYTSRADFIADAARRLLEQRQREASEAHGHRAAALDSTGRRRGRNGQPGGPGKPAP